MNDIQAQCNKLKGFIKSSDVVLKGSITPCMVLKGCLTRTVEEIEKQNKTIEITENGTTKVVADEGKALSKVTVEVSVPERFDEGYSVGKQDGYTEGYSTGKEEGYTEGYNKGFDDNKPVVEPLEVTENGNYTPSDNVDGYNSVSVNVPIRYEDLDAELTEQEELIATLQDTLKGKAVGGGGVSEPIAKTLIRSGNGYIDTGIDAANSNLKIEIRYEFLTMPTGYFYIIRAYVNESTNATRILYNKNTSVYNCLNSIPSKSLVSSVKKYANVVYTDILKSESSTTFSYATNGEKVSASRTSGTALEGKNLLLFNDSTSSDNVSIKVYYLKIYDGETLVRDYVPYITKSGECGLYDLVTKQFYGNDGDGTFEVETMEVIANE